MLLGRTHLQSRKEAGDQRVVHTAAEQTPAEACRRAALVEQGQCRRPARRQERREEERRLQLRLTAARLAAARLTAVTSTAITNLAAARIVAIQASTRPSVPRPTRFSPKRRIHAREAETHLAQQRRQ